MRFDRLAFPFFFLTAINIYFPTYLVSSSLSVSQILLFGLLFISVALVLLFGRNGDVFISQEFAVFLAIFLVLFFLQILYFLVFPNFSIVAAASAARYIFYPMVFLFGMNVARGVGWKTLYRFTMLMLVGQIIFMALQYLAPSSAIVTPFSRHHLYDYFGRRVGGTFNWTYIEGYFLILCVTFCIGLYRSGQGNGWTLFFLVLASLGVLATQSRTAIASFGFISAYMYLITGRGVIKSIPTLVVSGVLLVSLLYVFSGWIDMTYITNTLNSDAISEGAEGLRLTHRIATFSNISEMDGAELFVGGKRAMEITIENAYGHYTYRHGILGAVCYIFLLFFLYFDTLRKLRRKLDSEIMPILAAGHGIAVALFLFSMSSSPIDSHKLGFIILSYLGAFYGYYYKRQISLN